MIQRRQLFAVVLAIASGYTAQAVEPPLARVKYQITGVIVNSLDGSPVPHAHLSAEPVISGHFGANSPFHREGSQPGPGADADEQGRFTFVVPSAGKWRLTASAIGFVSQAYDEHDGFSSAVVLTQAKPAIELRFRIAPEAEIRGTVLDEAGEAVRNARVMLEHRTASSPDPGQQEFRNRMTVLTDDRGVYDFSGLAPGDYRVLVDAKPWYSTSQVNHGGAMQDPNLDVTYQLTWYPGVDDPSQAETLSLKAGDVSQANFQLAPIPAIHITFPAPASGDIGSRRFVGYPILERVDVAGSAMATSLLSGTGSGGHIEIGGLAPGLYRVRVPGGDQEAQGKLIEIRAGDSRIVDASAAASETANVSIQSDPPGDEHSFGVELINTENKIRFTRFADNMFFRAGPRMDASRREPRQNTLQIPPGRYEVRLTGQDMYLLGIAAKGAEVSGHFLTVHGGDVVLKLRTAHGRATVNGKALSEGKPVEGAMVVLVPAGLDDPGSFTSVVRDQTNTDGSFDLDDIVPGQYILIAVADGWQLNWNDAATLQRYLTQGIPLDIRPDAKLNQEITIQQP